MYYLYNFLNYIDMTYNFYFSQNLSKIFLVKCFAMVLDIVAVVTDSAVNKIVVIIISPFLNLNIVYDYY
ncbi:hypothetical protein JY402_09290 [Fusobacterium polymorphum]|uniref:hypothetical protein n=1 Tax=Fusobacterium nucleatum subsp. polymorphum TaxID=76857 RepID=UPI001C6F45A5|nr:hypothetical protein [Fusobacterium polymorphum]QYR60779.1 hypothetical protein JY402_09290 [Fusobacterium polymorphum]